MSLEQRLPTTLRLPSAPRRPAQVLLLRLAWALGLIVFVAVLVYLDRGGYRDAAGGEFGLLDAFYYSTVSVTTTGYGDITPVSDRARLTTTLLVTPARVLFLVILVGTTLEILADRTRMAIRERRWRRDLRDHTIVCGYGTKGRAAVETLVAADTDRERIVVIESRAAAAAEAQRDGLAVVEGDASQTHVLQEAGIADAHAVVVASDIDSTSVLITLTARELNAKAIIAAAAREEENLHLLRQGGANSVILTSGSAGRLLGQATTRPWVVEVLEDLLRVGEGLDLIEREIGPDQAGPLNAMPGGTPVVGVIRNGTVLRFDDERAAQLQVGDRVVCLCSTE